ncbi:MAG: hypothetical protein K2X35_18370 [Bryobacteraceae bacterium]|nr:hypothetical protein [Bryobacteraceae bacterium]
MKRGLLLLVAASALAADRHAGLEALKGLAGSWSGVRSDGSAVAATYEVVADGTAILARLHNDGRTDMVTMFTIDGAGLAAEHYCGDGNQPRLLSGPVASGQRVFRFQFSSARNLASPAAGRMTGLVITIEGKDRFSEEWIWTEGSARHGSVFRYQRVK